ncbi:MAG: DUF4212 domain-containing protein [Burkholderiaceae bacterium]|nr:DUF4212 domain-containing protein [Burkholderiaceae bacterium]
MVTLPLPPVSAAAVPGPVPPGLHDMQHARFKLALLLVWFLVSFGGAYFAHDLQALVVRGWPLGYWIAAQGAVLMFIAIVVVYCWAMDRFERKDARRLSDEAEAASSTPAAVAPHSHA